MRIIKKLLKYLLFTIIILLFTFPLWSKTVPSKYFPLFVGKMPIANKLLCNFSVKAAGQSMTSIIKPGTLVSLSRCFEEKDLTVGTIVLFQENSNLRFSIIRYILPLNPIVYKISDEKAPDLLHDVVKEEIIGINHDLDTSRTKYQARQNTESFIINPNEFITDFYLGKIPKRAGIENAKVVKTNEFFPSEDKFCGVFIPKKKMIGVSKEIINTKTQETSLLGSNIVFDLTPSPNIDCMEFGAEEGMLNLKAGSYRYRFLLNHQALEDISFIVN